MLKQPMATRCTSGRRHPREVCTKHGPFRGNKPSTNRSCSPRRSRTPLSCPRASSSKDKGASSDRSRLPSTSPTTTTGYETWHKKLPDPSRSKATQTRLSFKDSKSGIKATSRSSIQLHTSSSRSFFRNHYALIVTPKLTTSRWGHKRH